MCCRSWTRTRPRARLWARTSAYGDDKDRPLVRSSDGSYLYFAADVAYVTTSSSAASTGDLRARSRPPRLRRAAEGGGGDARLRPRPARGADLPARLHRRGRRGEAVVQTARRRRLPAGVRGEDRDGRGALVPRLAGPRPADRHRRRPRQGAQREEPGLLRPVRACQDRRDPPQRRATRSRFRAARRAGSARSASWSSGWPSFPRSSTKRPSVAHRTRFRPTRFESRTTSTASTTIIASWRASSRHFVWRW